MPVTYDPKDVAIILDSHIVGGYAEGTFIEIEPLGAGSKPVVGTDGEVTRSTSVDRSHVVTLTLMQTSDSHQILNDYMHADQRDGSGIFSLSVRDPAANASHYAYKAWVGNPPKYKYGAVAEEFTWTIYCESIETDQQGKGLGGLLGAIVNLAGQAAGALGLGP
jgi:hypothetical protein